MADYLWFKSYDAGVQHTLEPYPVKTLLDVFSETVKQRPDHTCTIFKGARISYGEMDKLTDAMAAALTAKGVKKGDTVAILLPNSPQALISQFGIWKAGGIPAPLNPLYTEDELRHGLNQCGAEIAIVFSPLYGTIKAFQSHHSRLRSIIAVEIKEFPTFWTKISSPEVHKKSADQQLLLQENDVWINDLLIRYSKDTCPNIKVTPGDIALLLQSGGTTGIPRGIMLTHKSLVAEAMQVKSWMKSVLLDWEDVILLNLPLFNVFGNAGAMSTAILGHNPMVLIPDPRDYDDLLDTIRQVRPAIIPSVPTLFAALLEHPAVKAKKVDFSPVKLCIAGAAPLSQDIKERFLALTGCKIMQGYGLTETSAAITSEPLQKHGKAGSVGLPLPDVIIRIVDSETGMQDDLLIGQEGEIIIKCPQLMLGFWNSFEETTEMLRDGWLYTGDIGYMDKDGYLFITSRKKDVIRVSGFQVWPNEIVQVIKTHPAIADVCVRGIPDPVQGESVKAWGVLHKGKKCTAEELQTYCRKKLTAYKVPRYIEFRDQLPRTLYGQDLCRKLAEEDMGRIAIKT